VLFEVKSKKKSSTSVSIILGIEKYKNVLFYRLEATSPR